MLKEQKGITLVALMITIIVLLILAGVTLSLTLGERGIFKTAQGARTNYMNAQAEEQQGLDQFDRDVNSILKDIR